jgi:excisionase family DNA binding protein
MAGTGTELLGFGDAQRYLGVSRSTLLRWLESGKVTGYKAGKKWKFRPEELERALVPATPGGQPVVGAAHERPVAYEGRTATPQSVVQELRKGGFLPASVEGLALEEGLWATWQDAQQWLWMACVATDKGARLDKRMPDAVAPASAMLSAAGATVILTAWQTWQRDAGKAARPGNVSVLRGGGQTVTVLRLPAHIDVVPAWPEMCRDRKLAAMLQAALDAGHSDWLVMGPAGRAPAAAAYALGRELAGMLGGAVTVVTNEDEPTYYWPGALQRYGMDGSDEAAGATIMVSSLTYEDMMPGRTAGSPAFRIGYCVVAADELPVCPGAIGVQVVRQEGRWACTLMELPTCV